MRIVNIVFGRSFALNRKRTATDVALEMGSRPSPERRNDVREIEEIKTKENERKVENGYQWIPGQGYRWT